MTAITRDEVWEMFREIARRFEATDQQFKETDRQFKETDRQFKETDRKLAQQSAETDRKIKEVTTAIGRLGNRLGQFVEEMVRPAVVRLFQERGIAVHEVHRRLSSSREGESMEIDLLVVNDGDAIAIEVKSELSVTDVNEHLERMARFKKLFPHYRNLRVMGAVAAMVLPDDVARYAYRQGLFVLVQNGDTVSIRNDAAFVPQGW